MARIIEVESPFGKLDLAGSALLELEKSERIVERQRKGLGQLELPAIAVEIGGLELLQLEVEPLPAKQPLAKAFPGSELDIVRAGDPALEAEAELGFLGEIIGQLLGLEVGRADAGHHPAVKLDRGELVAQMVLDLGAMLDLALHAGELLLGQRGAN